MVRSRLPFALVALTSAPLMAQAPSSPMTRAVTGPTLTFQLPSLEGDVSAMMLDAGMRLRLGGSLRLVAELPLMRANSEGAPGSGNITIGNPYLGLRHIGAHSMIDVGIRPPLMSDDPENLLPALVALFADADRFEAFLPEITTLRLRATFFGEPPAGTGVTWQAQLGPTYMRPSDGDAELFADYGAAIGYQTPTVHVQGGLTGRWLATGDGGDFNDQSLHQITLSATWRMGGVRPTAFLRLPMDDELEQAYTMVFGIGLVFGPR